MSTSTKAADISWYSLEDDNDWNVDSSYPHQIGITFEAQYNNLSKIEVKWLCLSDYNERTHEFYLFEISSLSDIPDIASDTPIDTQTITFPACSTWGEEWVSFDLDEPIGTDIGNFYAIVFNSGGNSEALLVKSGNITPSVDTFNGETHYDLLSPTARLYYDDTYGSGCPWGYVLEGEICVINDEVGLFFFSNPYICDNASSCKIDYLYQEQFFTPYDYISIYRYENLTSPNKTFVASTSIINYSVFGKQGGLSYFTLTGSSTISGLTYYDVVGEVAAYWNAETGTTTPATTTVPYVVVVDWGDIPTYDWTEQFATSSTSTDNSLGSFLDMNTHDLACSAEEWEEASESGVFNFTKLKCRTIKTMLDFTNASVGIIKKMLEWVKNIVLYNAFPVNIPLKIYEAWQDSETESLPSELAFLNSKDENGNLSITIPADWGDTGTATPIVVWGPAVFEANSTADNVFDFMRGLSTYMIWLMTIITLVNMGIMAFEEFMPKKPHNELYGISETRRTEQGSLTEYWHHFDD